MKCNEVYLFCTFCVILHLVTTELCLLIDDVFSVKVDSHNHAAELYVNVDPTLFCCRN